MVLEGRDGTGGEGIQRRGTRPLTFNTLFGAVTVERCRVSHRHDGTTEIPSASAGWLGGFAGPMLVGAGDNPTGLAVAGVNGDGIPDLLIGNAASDLLVLVDNGDGTFRTPYSADQSVALVRKLVVETPTGRPSC